MRNTMRESSGQLAVFAFCECAEAPVMSDCAESERYDRRGKMISEFARSAGKTKMHFAGKVGKL
jgi:hypothetical protein